MTILSPTPSPASDKIVHETLGHLMHGQRVKSLRGTPGVGAAVPRYQLSARDAARKSPFPRARKSGSAHMITGGRTPGLALVSGSGATARYTGLLEGAVPKRLLRAAARAERELGKSKQAFQPRLLDIPSHHILALWLYAPRGKSHFVLLTHSLMMSLPALRIVDTIKPFIDDAHAARSARLRAWPKRLKLKRSR